MAPIKPWWARREYKKNGDTFEIDKTVMEMGSR